jgi:hypothetical protein
MMFGSEAGAEPFVIRKSRIPSLTRVPTRWAAAQTAAVRQFPSARLAPNSARAISTGHAARGSGPVPLDMIECVFDSLRVMGARGRPAGISAAAESPAADSPAVSPVAVPQVVPAAGKAPAGAPAASPAGALYEGLVDPDGPVVVGEDLLPVLPALRGLLAAGGVQRGHVVATTGGGLLFLALAAAASAAGAWCAAVGLPALGVRAAVDAGLDPGRLLLVPEPGGNWPQVVASLLDGCDVVLLCPPARPAAQLRRKLEAAARRFGSALLVAGEWEGAQARLLVADQEWAGIGAGHGRLRARRARVVAEGRGAGARSRSAWLWLPGPDGTVRPAADHVITAMTRDAGLARETELTVAAASGMTADAVLAGTG